MLPPPPKITANTLVYEASETLVREGVPFLVVVEEDFNSFIKKRQGAQIPGGEENTAGSKVLGFVGRKQLFSV